MRPKVLPLLVVLVTAVLMGVVKAALPGFAISFPGLRLAALALLLASVIVVSAGISSFARAGTTTDPLNPDRASVLVTGGIFRYTRNPMYLGMALFLAAIALFLANWASLLLVLAFVWYMTEFQVKLEEQALERRFGEQYAKYKASVRRWL